MKVRFVKFCKFLVFYGLQIAQTLSASFAYYFGHLRFMVSVSIESYLILSYLKNLSRLPSYLPYTYLKLTIIPYLK